jgi:GT2 family glycosyltransferase
MGVNFGLGREAFDVVNGYNEQWTFPWREDYDLQLRLNRAGFTFYPLLNRAIVYHIYHLERVLSEEALALTRRQETSDMIRCPFGIESETAFDPNQ